jgi:hypothetical protein
MVSPSSAFINLFPQSARCQTHLCAELIWLSSGQVIVADFLRLEMRFPLPGLSATLGFHGDF